jgi:hypothetical protein
MRWGERWRSLLRYPEAAERLNSNVKHCLSGKVLKYTLV